MGAGLEIGVGTLRWPQPGESRFRLTGSGGSPSMSRAAKYCAAISVSAHPALPSGPGCQHLTQEPIYAVRAFPREREGAVVISDENPFLLGFDLVGPQELVLEQDHI